MNSMKLPNSKSIINENKTVRQHAQEDEELAHREEERELMNSMKLMNSDH